MEEDPLANHEKDVYLWGTGIVCSATSLTKVLGPDVVDSEGFDRTNRLESTKALPVQRIFSTNYVC